MNGIKVNNEAGSVVWNMIRNWNFCGKYGRLKQISTILWGEITTKYVIFEKDRLSHKKKRIY